MKTKVEDGAAKWSETYLTGEHGNHTAMWAIKHLWALSRTGSVQRLLLSRPDQGTSLKAWEADLKFFFAKYAEHPTHALH